MLDYRTEQTLAATVIRVSGEVDLNNAQTLKAELQERAASNHLILDLGGVAYIDMSGIRALEDVSASYHARGRLLVLTSPSLILRRVFHIIEFQRRIAIFDSREEALAYLQER